MIQNGSHLSYKMAFTCHTKWQSLFIQNGSHLSACNEYVTEVFPHGTCEIITGRMFCEANYLSFLFITSWHLFFSFAKRIMFIVFNIEVRVQVGSRIFSSRSRPDRLWGPLNLLSMGTGVSFPGVKRQGREADQLVPRSRKHGSVHLLPHTPSWRSA
jgi:hypothetical protein